MVNGFNDRLRYLRRKAAMSQEELAMRLNISRGAVSSWEHGLTEPTMKHLVCLSHIFNCSVDYLLAVDKRNYVDVTDVDENVLAAIEMMVKTLSVIKA